MNTVIEWGQEAWGERESEEIPLMYFQMLSWKLTDLIPDNVDMDTQPLFLGTMQGLELILEIAIRKEKNTKIKLQILQFWS